MKYPSKSGTSISAILAASSGVSWCKEVVNEDETFLIDADDCDSGDNVQFINVAVIS